MLILPAEDLAQGRVRLGGGDLVLIAAVGANVHYGAHLVRLERGLTPNVIHAGGRGNCRQGFVIFPSTLYAYQNSMISFESQDWLALRSGSQTLVTKTASAPAAVWKDSLPCPPSFAPC